MAEIRGACSLKVPLLGAQDSQTMSRRAAGLVLQKHVGHEEQVNAALTGARGRTVAVKSFAAEWEEAGPVSLQKTPVGAVLVVLNHRSPLSVHSGGLYH